MSVHELAIASSLVAKVASRMGFDMTQVNTRESHLTGDSDLPRICAVGHHSMLALDLALGPLLDVGRGDVVGCLEHLSRLNAQLPGSAKVSLHQASDLCLRTDISLTDPDGFGARLNLGLESLRTGWHQFRHPDAVTGVQSTTDDASPEGVLSVSDLQAVAAETGWAFDTRGDGALVFNVGSDAMPRHALVAAHGAGETRAVVEIVRLDSWEPVSRRALQVFLMRLNGILNFARAAIAPRNDQSVAVLEVVFQIAPTPVDMTTALECLCVGASLCFEEIRCLASTAVAEEYLEVGMEMFNAG